MGHTRSDLFSKSDFSHMNELRIKPLTTCLKSDDETVGFRLVQKIRQLLELDWEVKVCNMYREVNFCVDTLTVMSCRSGFKIIIYEQPDLFGCYIIVALLFICFF